MLCSRCRTDNREGRRFCSKCGAALAVVCASCGFTNEPGDEFCGGCGQRLGEAPGAGRAPDSYTPKHLAEKILISRSALEGERKQVTVLFADLKGSMELLAGRDPEEARALLDPVLELMMEAVHRYEGTVNQVMGDGIMALFGAPLAHEDHAVRACYAALRMQQAVKQHAAGVGRRHGLTVQIRVGLNSGDVLVRAIGSDLRMDYTAVGQTTHLAARMEQLAEPGAIVLSPATLDLVEGYVEVSALGPRAVKGLAEPVEVYELVGAGAVRSRLQAATARGLTHFVGRDGEREQLHQALERARAGHGQVVTVVGDPGVGKSRVVYEVTHSPRMDGWRVLESAAVSYGQAMSYGPVIDLLKGYFTLQERDALGEIRDKVTGKVLALDASLQPALPALLALLEVLGEDAAWQRLEPAQRRQRTLDAVKRLLLREARERPLLVLVEDLHWIDTESQALLDSLVESLPGARLLLLVTYRREYQHGWGQKSYYTQVRLDPLPPAGVDELLHDLLGDHPSLAPLTRLLIERAEGNPFFLEEGVRALVETRVLGGEPRAVSRGDGRRDATDPGDGAGGAGGADRSAASRGAAPVADGGGDRRRCPVRAAAGHCGAARGGGVRGPGAAAGDGVPVRGQSLPRAGIRLHARADARGGLRQSAAGAAARRARAHRGGDRGAAPGSARRAHRAARPSRPAGRAAGEGGGLSPAGRRQGGRAVGASGRGGLVRAGARCPGSAAGERVRTRAGLRDPRRAAAYADSSSVKSARD